MDKTGWPALHPGGAGSLSDTGGPYKVIILDDNELTCRSLEESIPWTDLGCTVAGIAGNGAEGLPIAAALHPDIVITDIRMPGMDGLEFIRHLRDHNREAGIIIITGYQEFSYAKRAMELGVKHLIPKPIDNQALIRALEELKKGMAEERQVRLCYQHLLEENKQYRKEMDQNTALSRNQLLLDLCRYGTGGVPPDPDILRELGLRDIRYMVLLGRFFKLPRDIPERANRRGVELLELFLSRYEQRVAFLNITDTLFLIIWGSRKQDEADQKENLRRGLFFMNDQLEKEYAGRYRFALSRMRRDITELSAAYEEANRILGSCFFVGSEELLWAPRHIASPDMDAARRLIRDLDNFYEIPETADDSRLRRETAAIIDRIGKSAGGNEFLIKCLLGELCITVLRRYDRLSAGDGPDLNRLLTEINGLNSIADAKELLGRYFTGLWQTLREQGRNMSPLIREAVAYIKENYHKDLSLTVLAKQLRVNPSYLSRLLKQETGRNFVDILSGIRIGAAKHLLDRPDSRVAEVCEAVGYGDYTYFYQVFKRLEKMSPSDYKKKVKKTNIM
jgi:DNA-binding NarL/FixJ family response regulator/AraC-like DNA-binding protein